MKKWGLDPIGFTVVPTLIFDTTEAKALYLVCCRSWLSISYLACLLLYILRVISERDMSFANSCVSHKSARPLISKVGRLLTYTETLTRVFR